MPGGQLLPWPQAWGEALFKFRDEAAFWRQVGALGGWKWDSEGESGQWTRCLPSPPTQT